MLRKGYVYEDIISELGEKGVSRRKALEYIRTFRLLKKIKTNGTKKTGLGKN